ncbi:hypothetical protein Trydic_g6277 [Trypoxylus dichotomus]
MVENDIFDILRPALYLRKYFGFLSVKVSKTTRLRFVEKSTIHFGISAIIQACILVLVVELYWRTIQYYSELESILEWMNYVMYYVLDIILLSISIVNGKTYNDRIIKIINRIAAIERDLKSTGIRLDYVHLKTRITTVVIVHVTVNLIHIITLAYMDYLSVGNLFDSCYGACLTLFVDYAQISHVVQFYSVVLISKNLIRKLSYYLEAIVYKQTRKAWENPRNVNTFPEEELIQIIPLLYENIFRYFKEFIEIVSFQMLFEFGLIFSIITFHTFNLIVLIFKNTFDMKYIRTVWFSVCLLMDGICTIVLYIIISEMYHKEVAALKETIFKVVAGIKDDITRKEMNALSLQISHENYEITAAGFFVIDMKLVFSIIAAIAVYSIVLMQFDSNAGVFQEYMQHHVL